MLENQKKNNEPTFYQNLLVFDAGHPALLECKGRESLMILPAGPNKMNGEQVLIYIEHHSVCPLVGIGTPPPL